MVDVPIIYAPPRTRSTILFDLLRDDMNNRLGTNVKGHSEPFLNYSYSSPVRSGVRTEYREILVEREDNIIRVIKQWPKKFNTDRDRFNFKLKVFSQAKDEGYEFFHKLPVSVNPFIEDFLDMFSHRVFLITDRRDRWMGFLSSLYAMITNRFHYYDDGSTPEVIGLNIDTELVDGLAMRFAEIDRVVKLIRNRTEHVMFYYEDHTDEESILRWAERVLSVKITSIPDRRPRKINIDYTKVFTDLDWLERKYRHIVDC